MLELIVSLAIIGIISGFIINNFADFRKQNFQNAAEEMVSNLRFIQNNALAGIKPCTLATDYTLKGWYIKLQPGATSYELGYICESNPPITYTLGPGKTIQLGSSFKISGFSWPNSSSPHAWVGKCSCATNPCPSTENYYYIFEPPKGELYYATIIEGIAGMVDFNPVKGLTSGTTAVGIILEDPNFKSIKNQYKGIGISPVGGITLKNLENSTTWPCTNPGTAWTNIFD